MVLCSLKHRHAGSWAPLFLLRMQTQKSSLKSVTWCKPRCTQNIHNLKTQDTGCYKMAIKHMYDDRGKNSPACHLHGTAGCKKNSSTRAGWDAGGARVGINIWEVRRGSAVTNLPLALLCLHESQQSRGITDNWFSLILRSKFTRTENGRCKLSHRCPADQ